MEKTKILVVDDEPDVLVLFEKYLTRKGFEVHTALNALEAIRVNLSKQPDLVITDYHMPGMNGVELLKELHEANPNLPVIMMSGLADMKSAVNALKVQAFDFLTKPIESQELIKIIHLALARKQESELPKKDPGKIVGPIFTSRLPEHPEIAILSFNRDLDVTGRLAYESAFIRLESEGEQLQSIVIVLRNVTYINNIGLNFLLDIYSKWQTQGRKIAFAQLSEPVFRYLQMLGYLDYFPISGTVAEAVEVISN